MEPLGPRIKRLRQAANLNKAALARRVGVSDVTISYWESGAIKQIGHERLVALSDALNCSLSTLLDGDAMRSSPLYLSAEGQPPWENSPANGIELPLELAPGQHWDGDCYMVTPAPGSAFDYLNERDLAAIAPTDIFRLPGLYLVRTGEHMAIRHVKKAGNGELQFKDEHSNTSVPYSTGITLLGKVVALWRSENV